MASTFPSLLPFFFLLLSCTLLPPTASPPPLPPTSSPSTSPSPTCTDELVLFSQCLPYVANPPNDLSSAASSTCCDAFSAAVKSNAAVCFCYLLQEPPILGFPLNSTRLLSLPSDCLLAYGESSRVSSLNSLCSESPTLPPLNNSATFGLPVSSTSGSRSGSSSPVTIPSQGAVGGGGVSSGNGGGNGSRPSGGESSSGVIGEEPPRQGGSSSSSSSSETEICRNRGWPQISLFSLLMSYM